MPGLTLRFLPCAALGLALTVPAGCSRLWLMPAPQVAPLPTAAAVNAAPMQAQAEPPPATGVPPTPLAGAGLVAPVVPTPFLIAPVIPTEEPVFSVKPTAPPTPTADPFLVVGPPTRLQISSIGVDAPVEMVGLTADHAMDVPKAWMNVGWYRDGYRPGEPGNAVLAGHLDTSSGGPAVFWSLDKVQPGDEVKVSYGNGDSYTFAVQGQEMYRYDAQGPIIDRIFGESITADLNLITCDGAWDHGRATYTHRLVVFTTLVPEKTVRAAGGKPEPVQ